jgi:hypothetical protein
MHHILLVATAAAIGLSAPAAFAQMYDPGGPTRIGNMCKVVTDHNGEIAAYGYYAPCPEQQPGSASLARAPSKRPSR